MVAAVTGVEAAVMDVVVTVVTDVVAVVAKMVVVEAVAMVAVEEMGTRLAEETAEVGGPVVVLVVALVVASTCKSNRPQNGTNHSSCLPKSSYWWHSGTKRGSHGSRKCLSNLKKVGWYARYR